MSSCCRGFVYRLLLAPLTFATVICQEPAPQQSFLPQINLGSPLEDGHLPGVDAGSTGTAVVAFDNTGEVLALAGPKPTGYTSPVPFPSTISSLLAFGAEKTASHNDGFKPLFPKDGVPEGWKVRAWSDVKDPPPEGAVWRVKDGVLHGSEPRGTWLVSDREYSNFTLKFEFKLGERGNSGCGLRFPGFGDPAFDGLELQMVDPRYYGDDAPNIPQSELTGSLYRAVAPKEQRLKPTDWNSYEVTLRGPHVQVKLNGAEVLNYNLDDHNTTVKRHNGQDATPLKDRPRKGHIGFQELSRGGAHVEIRNAQIKELN